jgi:hypothetical protein
MTISHRNHRTMPSLPHSALISFLSVQNACPDQNMDVGQTAHAPFAHCICLQNAKEVSWCYHTRNLAVPCSSMFRDCLCCPLNTSYALSEYCKLIHCVSQLQVLQSMGKLMIRFLCSHSRRMLLETAIPAASLSTKACNCHFAKCDSGPNVIRSHNASTFLS